MTERAGRLRIVATDGCLSEPLANVADIYHRGQRGLLDVTLDLVDPNGIYIRYDMAKWLRALM